MTPPTYNIGDAVYIRESAALGFLEAVQIASVQQYNGQWVYTIQAVPSQPTSPTLYGNRTVLVGGAILYFSEYELVDKCIALALVEARAQLVLNAAQTQKNLQCP